MYQQHSEGFAPVAACCFKGTITKAIRILIEKYGVSRSSISIIWGGMETKKKVKKKRKKQVDDFKGKLDFTNLSISTGMDADEANELFELLSQLEDEVEERVNEDVPKAYRLGAQSRTQRQEEIDRFQSGKTTYCFFTFKAGGVGLSLHHTDEMTTQKTRKKPNGYAVEADIPLIPIRPRSVTLTPTYSAPELVQGLGRCPRLTSLSDTYQYVVFYKGTIEERVAETVSTKLRCLKKVVKMRESWEDVVLKEHHYTNRRTEDIVELPKDPTDPLSSSTRADTKQVIQSDNPDDDSFLGGADSDKEDEEEE